LLLFITSHFISHFIFASDTSLPPDALLSEYLKESFLTSLLEQLPFEDDRISSPRVSVLKAVFRNCSALRQFLAHGLRQVSECQNQSNANSYASLDIAMPLEDHHHHSLHCSLLFRVSPIFACSAANPPLASQCTSKSTPTQPLPSLATTTSTCLTRTCYPMPWPCSQLLQQMCTLRESPRCGSKTRRL
jgi:hypothetical protein